MIKFSIIVPVYKAEKYLEECIKSILNQIYKNIEIILVDDGSPDNCPSICDNFAQQDSRVRVIHKKNGGQTSARQAGALEATGDYICCVDSDDYLAPDYILRFFESATKFSPDIICSGYVKITNIHKETSVPLTFRYGYYSKSDIEKEIFPSLIANQNANYFSPTIWGKAFQRQLFIKLQSTIDTRIKIGEDSIFIINFIYHSVSMCVLSNCSYYYRYNDTSITNSKKAFNWNDIMLRTEYLIQEININLFDFRDQLNRMIVLILFSTAVSQFNNNKSYRIIVKDIKHHLKEPIFRDALSKAKFKIITGKFALFTLKYKLFWLLKIWNKLKN